VHEDSTGRSGLLRPGLVQRMSAGTGSGTRNGTSGTSVSSRCGWFPTTPASRRDTSRPTGDGQRITAGTDGAEILVWEMHATPG